MKFAACALLLAGAAMLAWSFTLAPYTDHAAFLRQSMALTSSQSAAYHALRDAMLTPRFALHDYGITLIAAALLALVLLRKGVAGITTPNSGGLFLAIAIGVPLLTTGAYLFDLFQSMDRAELPQWADSLGIPVMAAPGIAMLLLVWSLGYLTFLRGSYWPRVPLVLGLSPDADRWLRALAFIGLAGTLFACACGQYWYAIGNAGWVYFHLSLGAMRRVARHAAPR